MFILLIEGICELLFYVQIKAQVKLFITTQVIVVQERQLLDMLDTVPDKVLVCSIERQDEFQARPLYNNRQMKEFFGQSLVAEQKLTKKVSGSAKSKKKRSGQLKSLFKRRIFQQRENPGILDQNERDNPEFGDAERQDAEESLVIGAGEGDDDLLPTF